MKFALFIATLALVSGIQKNKKDDIKTPAGFEISTTELKSAVGFGSTSTSLVDEKTYDKDSLKRIVGVSFDNTSYADFVQFRLADAGKSLPVEETKPKPTPVVTSKADKEREDESNKKS